MSKYDPNGQDIDDLLRQVDSLLDDEPEDDWYDGDEVPQDIDLDEYSPFAPEDEDLISYQNYSNDYGRQVRNYNNGYSLPKREPEPVRSQPVIPAYNADFHQPRRERNTGSQAYKAQQRMGRENVRRTAYPEPVQKSQYRDYGDEPDVTEYVSKPKKQPKAPKPRRGCGCGCLPMLIGLAVAVVLLCMWLFQPPISDVSIGERKSDTATVLICGADIGNGRDDSGGSRTDTMMLLYLSGSEKKVSLMSLPRDTYTITSRGAGAKLNSAYGRNGTGAEGMEGLMDYVQEIIGYRPDGYILVDMTLVTQIVDLMGGVEVEVPQTMELDGITLDAGLQELDGTQVLTLLRYRKGYATADLGRVEVQRNVIKACMDQWISVSKLGKLPQALELVQNNSISSLGTRNYLWIGKTLLTSLSGGFTTETLPGYADYIGDASYYILNRDQVAQMVNDSFNPYKVTISPDDLKIAG